MELQSSENETKPLSSVNSQEPRLVEFAKRNVESSTNNNSDNNNDHIIKKNTSNNSDANEIEYSAIREVSHHSESQISNSNTNTNTNKSDLQIYEATSIRNAANISLYLNILLFITKLVVFSISLSISVVASLVDSALDLTTQLIMFWTERNVTRVTESYPVGKTRLEPVGIMAVSVLMIISAVTVIREAIFVLINNINSNGQYKITFDYYIIGSLCLVIGLKFFLWLYCRRFKYSPIALALAEDHVNDVCSNAIAVSAAVVAWKIRKLWWIDPSGGILISCYIIYSWWSIGRRETKKLIGHKANIELIGKLEQIAKNHHENMIIDVLKAYHIGRNILVEVEAIMPKKTTLEITHDVSLSLQQKLEEFDFVERAFVHVDYESRGYDEHKTPILS